MIWQNNLTNAPLMPKWLSPKNNEGPTKGLGMLPSARKGSNNAEAPVSKD